MQRTSIRIEGMVKILFIFHYSKFLSVPNIIKINKQQQQQIKLVTLVAKNITGTTGYLKVVTIPLGLLLFFQLKNDHGILDSLQD